MVASSHIVDTHAKKPAIAGLKFVVFYFDLPQNPCTPNTLRKHHGRKDIFK
jgi:hypothetical protein